MSIMKLGRVRAGYSAKKRGEMFENLLKNSGYRKGWHVIRIPDGCKQLSATKLIRIRTPFDFVFLKQGKAVFVDAKVTKSKTYSFSALTAHQVQELTQVAKQGFTSGYIISFSELDKVVFFNSEIIANLAKKSGIKPDDGVQLGSMSDINLDLIFKNKTLPNALPDGTI